MSPPPQGLDRGRRTQRRGEREVTVDWNAVPSWLEGYARPARRYGETSGSSMSPSPFARWGSSAGPLAPDPQGAVQVGAGAA
jgi:hypothetical protein